MLVTPDVIGVIIAAFGGAATLLAGVAGLNARMMRRIDVRFEQVDARFDRMDARFDRLETRMERVEAEVIDLKVAVARFEGPQPRLLRP